MKFEIELEDEEICTILDIGEMRGYLALYPLFKTALVVKEDDGSRWISVDDLLEKVKCCG